MRDDAGAERGIALAGACRDRLHRLCPYAGFVGVDGANCRRGGAHSLHQLRCRRRTLAEQAQGAGCDRARIGNGSLQFLPGHAERVEPSPERPSSRRASGNVAGERQSILEPVLVDRAQTAERGASPSPVARLKRRGNFFEGICEPHPQLPRLVAYEPQRIDRKQQPR